MQLQRQSIRVMKKCHLISGVLIHSDRFAYNPDFFQLFHCLLYTVHTERQMPEPTGFRSIHTLRWICFCKNLQLCMFIDAQIQLPVLPL